MDVSVAEKAKSWIGHCLKTHLECRPPQPRLRAYPTRLLDVREVAQAGLVQIFQVPASFEDDYIALSYCWGGKRDWWLQYIKACQRSDCKIDFNKMPQTYQDAVTTCLALKYSYLWVDCLCILQGNKADWLTEG